VWQNKNLTLAFLLLFSVSTDKNQKQLHVLCDILAPAYSGLRVFLTVSATRKNLQAPVDRILACVPK